MNLISRKCRDPMIALASGHFAMGLFQTCFMFYYVKVYLNVFKISEGWFSIAQGLFLVWNAVNDPLFGYFQDSTHSWFSNRRLVIKYLAPLISLSFVLLWVQAPYEQGLHLCVALFLYDAFFSAIGVAWSAMFAEVEGGAVARASAMKHSQLAILLSVNVIPLMEKTSNSLQDFATFQRISVLLAGVGWACFWFCANGGQGLPHHQKSSGKDEERLLGDDGKHEKSGVLRMQSVREVLSRRDFVAILFVNAIHTARSVMHLNFASITTELLIPQSILPKGSLQLSTFYALCTLAPQIIAILSEGLVVRLGAHKIIQSAFLTTVAAACLLYGVSGSPYMIMVYMFIDSVTVHATAPLFNIIISEFIEDDSRRNERSKPLSSLVFGLNAFFVKPSQSIAPLIVVHYLNGYGYEEYKKSHEASPSLIRATHSLLFIPPLFLAAAQYVAFRVYSLGERNRIHRLTTI